MSKLRLDIITIFPEYLQPLRHALLGRAIEQKIVSVGIHNLRDWATGNHKSVDAPPLGGGPGMVMKPEVWGPALDDVASGRIGEDIDSAVHHRNDRARHDDVVKREAQPYEAAAEPGDPDLPLLLVPTPAGSPFTQADARAWSREDHIVIACGRYEGIDQRVFEDAARRYRVREVSIGDYVLIGGEVAALVIAEAVTRLIPGVLGNARSHQEDSFSDGLLEAPSYTRPRRWRGLDAPDVLLSGDHARVDRWRRNQSLQRTARIRPDLLETAQLNAEDLFVLNARPFRVEVPVPEGSDIPIPTVRKKLRKAGIEVARIDLDTDRTLVVEGRAELKPDEVTRVVLSALRSGR